MKKYIKKPIPVEAIYFDGSIESVKHITSNFGTKYFCFVYADLFASCEYIEIVTLEGVIEAYPGWYIVKGPAGEFWPVKKEIFDNTYEEIE